MVGGLTGCWIDRALGRGASDRETAQRFIPDLPSHLLADSRSMVAILGRISVSALDSHTIFVSFNCEMAIVGDTPEGHGCHELH